MRVLHLINTLGTAGAQKLIVDSLPLYEKRSLFVDVVVLKDSITYFRTQLESEIQGNVIGLTKGSIYNPLLIFKIIPYLKQYDVIHMHLFPTLYWVVLAKIISFSRVKLIYTEHNTNNRRRHNSIFKVIDRFIYSKLETITAITESVKSELQNHLQNKNKIVVINNGIKVSSFNIKEYTDLGFFSPDDFVLIQVSSFSKQKDQVTIIKSMKFLPEKVKLLLVGDGHLIEDNKKLVEELNLLDRVTFLGNRYDVPELVNYADITILSSHWEGFGLSVLEGMAACKPAIASNVDGLREIVEGYGLLFKRGDEEDLSRQVLKLVNNADYYNEVANRCFKRAKDFDINKMVDSFIQLYNK